MNNHLKAFGAAFVVTAALGLLWVRYKTFLTQGSEPPQSTLKLNEMKMQGVPAINMKDIDGKELSLEQYKNRVVIINFWASWCAPCVDEFPSLLQLIKHFDGKVVVIAISADYEEADIRKFLKAFDMKDPNMRVAWDKGQTIAQEFGTEILPESYILNRKGQLVRKVVGVDEWFSESAKHFFTMLTEGKM